MTLIYNIGYFKGAIQLRIKLTFYEKEDREEIENQWQPTATYYVDIAEEERERRESDKLREIQKELERKLALLEGDIEAKNKLIREAEEAKRKIIEESRRKAAEMAAKQKIANIDVDKGRADEV